jgi:hypothetical protein
MKATLIAIVLIMQSAFGQSVPAPRSFEVAAIKSHPEPVSGTSISTSGTGFRAEAMTIEGLVMYA